MRVNNTLDLDPRATINDRPALAALSSLHEVDWRGVYPFCNIFIAMIGFADAVDLYMLSVLLSWLKRRWIFKQPLSRTHTMQKLAAKRRG